MLARIVGFPAEARRIAPKVFEAVELAFVAMKDVDDDLQVIEHDPLARREIRPRQRRGSRDLSSAASSISPAIAFNCGSEAAEQITKKSVKVEISRRSRTTIFFRFLVRGEFRAKFG